MKAMILAAGKGLGFDPSPYVAKTNDSIGPKTGDGVDRAVHELMRWTAKLFAINCTARTTSSTG